MVERKGSENAVQLQSSAAIYKCYNFLFDIFWNYLFFFFLFGHYLETKSMLKFVNMPS